MHAGGPEEHISLHTLQVGVTAAELAAHRFQIQHLLVQLFPGRPVAAGDIAAEFQQQPHQGPVADAQAQDGDLLAPQGSEILFKGHNFTPLSSQSKNRSQRTSSQPSVSKASRMASLRICSLAFSTG